MKKRLIVGIIGFTLALSACGNQSVTQTPDETPAETTAESTEATSEEAGETTESSETSESAETAESEEETGDSSSEEIEYIEDDVISAENFSVRVPDELKGKVLAGINGEAINFYDKATVDEGYPGYVFSIVTTKDNGIMAGGMFEKVGEISAPDGSYYNVCVGYASDVQWDYTKHEKMPESYESIEKSVDAFVQNVEAKEGTFVYKGGTKGEDFYTYTLTRYIDAINENWDANKFEEENMSPEFYAIAQTGENPLDRIGYAYMDISHDGVDELLLGEITDSDEPTVIYDVYTVVDRQPAHIVSGSARDRYYALEYGGLANEYSGGASESGINVYEIESTTTNLFKQYSIKYDGYTDEKNPWFICYSDEQWEPMTEADYNERYDMTIERYQKIDLKPLSDLAPIDYSKVDLSKYDTFTRMIDDFKPGMGYANEKLGDTDVFLVSSGTFNGDNDTKNAIDASIFMYGDNGIVYLGQIASAGTANPLAISDGMIFTGAHHTIIKSTVKDGKLITVERDDELYDENGKENYTRTLEDGVEKEVADDTFYSAMYDEYFKAQVIEFSEVK